MILKTIGNLVVIYCRESIELIEENGIPVYSIDINPDFIFNSIVQYPLSLENKYQLMVLNNMRVTYVIDTRKKMHKMRN